MLSHCAVVAEELLRRCCAAVGAELKKTAQTAGDEVDTNTARVKTRAAFLLHLAPLNAVLPATTAALEGEGKALEDSVQEVTTAWHQKLPPASQSTPAHSHVSRRLLAPCLRSPRYSSPSLWMRACAKCLRCQSRRRAPVLTSGRSVAARMHSRL